MNQGEMIYLDPGGNTFSQMCSFVRQNLGMMLKGSDLEEKTDLSL